MDLYLPTEWMVREKHTTYLAGYCEIMITIMMIDKSRDMFIYQRIMGSGGRK